MTQLLVSVRSAREAEAALRGGAWLIDVKEPAHGALGRADDGIIDEVVGIVAGQCPVSAALGELAADAADAPSELPLAYVKWGLAGSPSDWRRRLGDVMRRLAEHRSNCRAVAVAYADWHRARAPTPAEVCAFAVENAAGAFLVDTWSKDGSTLLDWLSLNEIEYLRERCRAAGVPMALAGSLGADEITTLLPLRPDWFAVRGAVCRGRRRDTEVEESRVRQLSVLIRSRGQNQSEPEA